jgi:hypothetical protein
MQPDNQQLREALDHIVDRYACDEAGEQIRQIKNLAQKYPHSISLVYEAIPNKPETFSFNCYQHSFDLVNVEHVDRIMKTRLSIFPGREYASFLIDNLLREIRDQEAQDGDHVFYSTDLRIEHAGKIRAGAIESKWGLMHLLRHALYEVPSRYGNKVRFFTQLSQSDAVQVFLDFAAAKR